MSIRKVRVLFLCTGNSCRSQIAEGWVHHLGKDRIEATSAGIEAHGKNPNAIAVMHEAGVDISHQKSTRLSPEKLSQTDLVVTVCGHADEHCPVLPTGVQKKHWPLEDPARASGTEEQIMKKFRATRDEIRERVEVLIEELTTPLHSD